MNPTVALPGSMTWMGIRLSSGSRPQSPKGLPLLLLNRFSVATVSTSQRTFGVIPFPQILPALLIDRNTRPVVICADSVQESTVLFAQRGIGTVLPRYTRAILTGAEH